jgi:predicted transglutaminase-like cysteine proteinase
VAGFLISFVGGAFLASMGASLATALPPSASMREDGFALAPFSFAKFCIDYPSDCPSSGGQSRVQLTRARLAQLSEVNRRVNAAIKPTQDTSALRYWHLNVGAGDCNAFAIQKRHELLSLGWSAGALALTVAQTSWGEGHLVVTVRTDDGDLVLDNLRSKIVSWQQAGYHFVMRQSGSNPQFWVELHGGHVGQQFAARNLDDSQGIAEPNRPKELEVKNAPRVQTLLASMQRYRNSALEKIARGEQRVAEPLLDDKARIYGTLETASEAMKDLENNRTRLVGAAGKLRDAALADWRNISAAAPVVEQMASDIVRFVSPPAVDENKTNSQTVAALKSPLDPTAFGFM